MSTLAVLRDLRRAYAAARFPHATWSTVPVEGVPCEVLAVGQGDPLVLIHGGLDSCMQWAPILGRLARHHRCFAVERPSNGASGHFRYRGYAGDPRSHFARVVRDLMDGIRVHRAPLVGNSLGGLAAAAFALDYPERAERLVFVGAPAGHEDHRPPRPVRLLASPVTGPLVAALSRRGTRADARRSLRALACRDPERVEPELVDIGVATTRHNARAWHEFLRWAVHGGQLRPELRSQNWMPRLRMPVTYVIGEYDTFATPAHVRRVADGIGAAFHLVPGAGHLPWLDEPHRTVEALLHTRSHHA